MHRHHPRHHLNVEGSPMFSKNRKKQRLIGPSSHPFGIAGERR
jgi:hypothetical protein